MLTFTEFLLFFISLELLVMLLLLLRPNNGASNEHNAFNEGIAFDERAASDEDVAFDESADELERAWRQTLTELLDYNQDKARGAARGGGQQ